MNSKLKLPTLGNSFGRKVLLSFAVVIIAVLTVFTAIAVVMESGRAKDDLRKEGEMLSNILSRTALVGVFAENKEALKDAAEGVVAEKNVISISIHNADLQVLYARNKTSSGITAPMADKFSVTDLTSAQSLRVIETYNAFEIIRPVTIIMHADADESLYFSSTTRSRERIVGYVRILLSKNAYHKEIASLLAFNAAIAIIIIASSVAIIYLSVKKVTRPLERLTESVKAHGRGLPVEPAFVESDDEIGNLAAAFNAMVVARGRAEESLRESEQRFRLIAETIDEVFWIADLEISRMIYVSPAYERVWGRSRESLYQNPRSFLDAVHADDRERLLATLEARKAGQAWECEYRIIRPDGAIISIWDNGYPVRDEAGRITSYVGAAHDITEHKKADEALRLSQETLRKIIDGSSAVIFAKDRDGKYLFINSLFEKTFHVSKDTIIEQTDYDLFPHETATALQGADRKVFQSGTAIEAEERVPQDDGMHYYISLKFPLFDNCGNIYAVCGIATDITERKQAEEKLHQYHEQLAAMTLELSKTEARERRRIAVELHDMIGQSLAIMKIKLGMLRRAAASGIMAHDLDEIRSQVDEAIQFTRTLTFELSPPALYQFGLEVAIEGLASQIQAQHAVSVTVKKSGQADQLGEELRVLLFKTVRELLMNIVKHASARTAAITFLYHSAYITIIVEDDGKGFEVENNLPHQGPHGGFGLFSVSERIRQLGGTMEIDSRPGIGTRVSITTPMNGQGRE